MGQVSAIVHPRRIEHQHQRRRERRPGPAAGRGADEPLQRQQQEQHQQRSQERIIAELYEESPREGDDAARLLEESLQPQRVRREHRVLFHVEQHGALEDAEQSQADG